VDDPEFAFKITRAELALGADTRIVEQQVNRYASLLSESEDLCGRIGLRKIGGQHFDADAMQRAQSCAQGRKPPCASGSQDEMCAASSQFLRQGGANPGSRAGDQRPLSTPGAVCHDGNVAPGFKSVQGVVTSYKRAAV
jgi:hypothetical protein